LKKRWHFVHTVVTRRYDRLKMVVGSRSRVASSLRIRLCGGLAVEVDGERVEDRLPSRQARVVFALLVDRRGRPTSRESLGEALWGDQAPRSRDVALRAVLSGVRRALGPDSVAGRGEVRLVLPADAWIDAESATRDLENAERALEAGKPREARRYAGAAGDVLEGELLPGCRGPWVEKRRTELEELGRDARELEARASLILGDGAGAERICRRLIERAPYRESAHGLLMDALASRGNVAEAVLAYDRLRTLLREDLGTVPAPGITARHERLIAGEGRDAAGEIGRPRAARREGRRLLAAALAIAGIALFAVGLAEGSGSGTPRAGPAAGGAQETVLPRAGVALRYPSFWTLRALPSPGIAGAGSGATFCNLFRIRGAGAGRFATAELRAYAGARLREWSSRAPGAVVGPLRTAGASAPAITATERDSAYGVPEAGRIAFLAVGPDLIRVECSAPPAAFRTADRSAFRPLIADFRAEPR
jgi:DNA-binding SARP family transcriptional activator